MTTQTTCTHPRMETGKDITTAECVCPDCKQGFTASEVAAQSWRKVQALIVAASRSVGHTHGVFCHIFGCPPMRPSGVRAVAEKED